MGELKTTIKKSGRGYVGYLSYIYDDVTIWVEKSEVCESKIQANWVVNSMLHDKLLINLMRII